MLHLIYFQPLIAGNTGAAIRLCACTGSHLHLIAPLGFDITNDKKLKRAGLDYHDMAHVSVHQNFDDALAGVSGKVYGFTGHARTHFSDIRYHDGDALLFGPEDKGLPQEVMADRRLEALVRIPMKPGLRSLNLTNSASIALYEALRQNSFFDLI